MIRPGSYQLRIRLRRSQSIEVGRLGRFDFPAGWYVYSGSARGGVDQRIARHLRSDKRLHWHIDYLLQVADRVEAFESCGEERHECELQARLGEGRMIILGFGASDCACRTHLLYFPRKPELNLPLWQGTALRQRRLQR